MTTEDVLTLCNGVYRIHWVDGGAWSVASVGTDCIEGKWYAPANWTRFAGNLRQVPCNDWDRVERVSLIEASPY